MTAHEHRGPAGVSIAYFYTPGTCSLAGMVALEAAGCTYRAHEVDLSGDRRALRAVSAAGQVPVLTTNGAVVTDTVAIVSWVHRAFPSADILPTADPDHAQALSFMAWCGSTLHIVRRRFARPAMFAAGTEAQDAVRRAAAPAYREGLRRLDAWLSSVPPCWGVTGYALVFHQWAILDEQPIEPLAYLRALFNRAMDDPAAARALAAHRFSAATAPAKSLQTATGG